MFSLSYLPTAERLTVVVVKARNLKFQVTSSMEVFVKVNKLTKLCLNNTDKLKTDI